MVSEGMAAIGLVITWLFLAGSLMGCATSRIPEVQYIKREISIPEHMFRCGDGVDESRPVGETIMESQVAKYITTLEFVNKDCKLRLQELKILIDCANDDQCNVDTVAKYIGLVRESKES